MEVNTLKEEEENKNKSEIFTSLTKKVHKRRYSTVTTESDTVDEEDPEKIISDLQQKLILLEKVNKDLQAKNEDLTKKNIEKNTLMTKMSLVGLRRGFATSEKNEQDDSIKLAEIIKEKDDLQEINEKMLDLLTDKEIENEDLLEKLEKNKLEAKLENEKNLEKIQNLEDKIQMLESSKSIARSSEIDDIINEYNNYKERLKKQINEYSKNEDNLKEQLEMKERTIQRLKEEIQGLELENLHLTNQSEKKDEINEKEVLEIEQLKHENDKIKREMTFLDEKLKIAEENALKSKKTHESEISDFQKQIENEQNYLKSFKESKSKEIDLLKKELNKNSREINLYNKKIKLTEKKLNDEKEKNFMIQNKLDKKSKELQDINDYTKKLLSNKDILLSKYEEKIKEIIKDKNNLISQNKELLERIKTKNEDTSTTNLAEVLNEDEDNNKDNIKFYIQENKLLNEEMKELKEQLTSQTKELVELNSLDKEVVRLKTQNESLINDNKDIKNQLEEIKKKEKLAEVAEKRNQLAQFFFRFKKKPIKSIDNKMEKLIYEKQLNALKKMKEDEKKDYEEQIMKMKIELAMLKFKNSTEQKKNDFVLSGYKNIIKWLSNQNHTKNYLIFIVGIIILICAIKLVKK